MGSFLERKKLGHESLEAHSLEEVGAALKKGDITGGTYFGR